MTENSENTKDSEIKDPHRENQIEAEGFGPKKRKKEVSQISIFGWVIREARTDYVVEHTDLRASKGDEISDDDFIWRTFLVRCTLLKILKGFKGKYTSPFLSFILDGFNNVSINVGNTIFVFDEKIEAEPEAEVIYRGLSTRYGDMDNRTDELVRIFFKDKEQMNKYLSDL